MEVEVFCFLFCRKRRGYLIRVFVLIKVMLLIAFFPSVFVNLSHFLSPRAWVQASALPLQEIFFKLLKISRIFSSSSLTQASSDNEELLARCSG